MEILCEHRSDPLPVWMVYPNARYTPAKVRLFIDYFCENIERLTQQRTRAAKVARAVASTRRNGQHRPLSSAT